MTYERSRWMSFYRKLWDVLGIVAAIALAIGMTRSSDAVIRSVGGGVIGAVICGAVAMLVIYHLTRFVGVGLLIFGTRGKHPEIDRWHRWWNW